MEQLFRLADSKMQHGASRTLAVEGAEPQLAKWTGQPPEQRRQKLRRSDTIHSRGRAGPIDI